MHSYTYMCVRNICVEHMHTYILMYVCVCIQMHSMYRYEWMAILMYVNCTCVYVLLLLHAVCKLCTNGNRFCSLSFSVQERAVCARSMVYTGCLTATETQKTCSSRTGPACSSDMKKEGNGEVHRGKSLEVSAVESLVLSRWCRGLGCRPCKVNKCSVVSVEFLVVC